MVAESQSRSQAQDRGIKQISQSISQLLSQVPESLVISAPQSSLLYFKHLSFEDPSAFNSEFEKFILPSLIQTQKNKILVYLGNKIRKFEKAYERSKSEAAALGLVSKTLKDSDFVELWNASLNAQDLWKVQDKVMPVSAIYFRTLLGGIND